ncbi:MAG: ABC transporter permease [Bacteroidales bacterium]|nr:ABC transporter permease [Bacteroidales bacterium]
MNLSKIKLIIGREYAVRVKKKSFLITTIVTPLLMALLMVVPSLIIFSSKDKDKKIMIVDESGIMESYFESTKATSYLFATEDVQALKNKFKELEVYALVHISALDAVGEVAVTSYSKEPLNIDARGDIADKVNAALRDRKIQEFNFEGLDEMLDKVKCDVKVTSLKLGEDGSEKKDSVEVYMILAYLCSFLIYTFVLLFGNMVMRGVIEEKQNRIVEVIVSSVSSFELMMGKIIGVALVALTQFFIWVVLLAGTVVGLSSFFGDKMTPDAGAIAQQVPGMENVSAIDMETAMSEIAESNVIQDILQQIAEINFVSLILAFLAYFILGYLLYAAMFAAVGSAVDNEADTGQLSLPVTMPLIIGLFIMLNTFQYPNSALSVWTSIIPFTSPMVMLARIPFGVVPAWQLGLSLGLLFLTFVFMAYVSAKIYKVGILTYGKKATFKDLFKWIRYKE